MGIHGASWGFMGYHGVSCDFMGLFLSNLFFLIHFQKKYFQFKESQGSPAQSIPVPQIYGCSMKTSFYQRARAPLAQSISFPIFF